MNTETISILVGAVLPFLMEFIIKYVKDTRGKFLVSLFIPLLIGGVLNANNLSVANIDEILKSGAIIFSSAQTVYKLYFRDSALQRSIDK